MRYFIAVMLEQHDLDQSWVCYPSLFILLKTWIGGRISLIYVILILLVTIKVLELGFCQFGGPFEGPEIILL